MDEKIIRCAIYTRKSHEDGLEQEFNSLDAQRDAAENYIASQKMNGWIAIPEHYDDGGFSGSNMERPAMKKLLDDVRENKIDCVVVYKIDRLSRSLVDFMQLIELFNSHDVSFVSVTQHFSTTDSAGRMMLNILMTFAQYEREIISERIRDKIAGAKRRGKYCGGSPVIGYDVDPDSKKLKINKAEAKIVKYAFKRYPILASAKHLAIEMNQQGFRTKSWTSKKGHLHGGREWNSSHIYNLLKNRIYLGEVTHKDKHYPGEHERIISQELWEQVQAVLNSGRRNKVVKAKTKILSPLQGILKCGHCNASMGITYTKKSKEGKLYTYYICMKDHKEAASSCPIKRVGAGDIEKAILQQISSIFRTPTIIAKTYQASNEALREEINRMELEKKEQERLVRKKHEKIKDLRKTPGSEDSIAELKECVYELEKKIQELDEGIETSKHLNITEQDISKAFENIDGLWNELFPIERQRLISLLLEKVEIRESGIDMIIKKDGMHSLLNEVLNQ